MSSTRKRLVGTLGLAVAVTGLSVPFAATASAAGPGLVISEVYGGGGNSGAVFKNDFIELRNTSTSPISLGGKSLQYRSATSGSAAGTSNIFALPEVTLPAGGHFLVQGAAGTGTAPANPTPDATSTLNLSGTTGQLALANQTAPVPLTTGPVSSTAVIDYVGWGAASGYEGTGPAPATTNATSSSRNASGTDTDNNSADFATGTPTPTNSAAGGTPDPEPEPDPDPTAVAIAEVQGTGATSPLAGQTVTTEGVVTAAYPTGGYHGFYLQTGGPDTTPGASDGLFVYAPSFTDGYPAVGDSVRVTGAVSEFGTMTQVTAASAAAVERLTTPLPAVVPRTTVPGTDCALPGDGCPTGAALDAAREAHEGEAFLPTAPYTVTDVYDGSAYNGGSSSSGMFGEIGLAGGSEQPLVTPTEVVDAQATEARQAREAYNTAHRVILDDGSSTNYASAANQGKPFPYLTADHTVRVGAAVTFDAPVVLDHRFGWKLQPQRQVVGQPTGLVTFEQDRPERPADVGGDLRLATFNVLNYFTTLGTDVADCTSYNDRAGDPVTVRSCPGNGPRGAFEAEDLERQQAKIVASINALDADVVSLEEIENSLTVDGHDRDEALAALVRALNAAAGSTRWDYVRSPAEVPADEDVIRTGFIYDPSTVETVGAAQMLIGSAAFHNAREPFAQAFKAAGGRDRDAFAVIANHFKSKGSGDPDPDGQGNANADRVAQANALVDFADQFADSRGITKVFLAGDFNAYSEEDPVQAIEAAGYTALESTDDPAEESYSFDGAVGSLDHVFANEAAVGDVTGVDIWTTNAYESVYYEYSRHNYNVTDLYAPGPFRASDHNPEIVGIDVPEESPTVDVNLLNINDFHGRIDANTTKFATTVEQLRAAGGEENTLFLSAGDNIGASLFASASQDDNPTIDVLNALDLATSAVGNHELDRGYADLTGRVAERAEWDYLAANVYRKGTTTPALPEYDTFVVDGVTVGVIGAVTEETGSLVSPAGIAEIEFGDPVEAVNRVAARLTDGDEGNGEADVLVAEYHEGAGFGSASTVEAEVAEGGVFADIVTETSPEVDAIFTGHTHKEYAWSYAVPGEPTRTRPVLQTGSYGERVGQIVLRFDRATGDVTAVTNRNVNRAAAEDLSFPRVQEVKRITDAALKAAAELGNQPVGRITADITTAFSGGSHGTDGRYAGGTRDNRAEESTLGDLVANALRDGVDELADPDLGITNPGGLRAELLHAGSTASNPANTDGVVTYAEANAVLPFNNTVAIVELTGAELEQVLEQQWQTDEQGNVPSRAYLQLGLSDNVRVTVDRAAAAGSRVTSVFIDDEPLDPQRTYTVSTLSFLATGGDNFRAFREGSYTDTGLLDAQMWRDYLAANQPLSPDFARQQVDESGLPESVRAGETVGFTLSRLDLTSLGSPRNTTLVATGRSDGRTYDLGSFAVDQGRADVTLEVPTSMAPGGRVDLVAQPSGTTVTIPVEHTVLPTTVAAEASSVAYGSPAAVRVTVDPASATGQVEVRDGARVLATGTLVDGTADVRLPRRALEVGSHRLTVAYLGDATHEASATVVEHVVTRAASTTTAASEPTPRKGWAHVEVRVAADGVVPTGDVVATSDGDVVATGRLVDGRVTLVVGPFQKAGSYDVVIRYAGDEHVLASATEHTIRVVKK